MKPFQVLTKQIKHQGAQFAGTAAWSLLMLSLVSLVSARAESSYPYSCEWTSEVATEAVIRFNRSDGIGTYRGELLYNKRKIMGFQEGTSQGYGMSWWSNTSGNASPEPIVVFNGSQPVRAATGFGITNRNEEPQRLLIVGLGRHLYYANPQWRHEEKLSSAAEGFWKIGKDCHAF